MALFTIANKTLQSAARAVLSSLADNYAKRSKFWINMVFASYNLLWRVGGWNITSLWLVNWRFLLFFKSDILHKFRRILVFSRQSNLACLFIDLKKATSVMVFPMKCWCPLKSFLPCPCDAALVSNSRTSCRTWLSKNWDFEKDEICLNSVRRLDEIQVNYFRYKQVQLCPVLLPLKIDITS